MSIEPFLPRSQGVSLPFAPAAQETGSSPSNIGKVSPVFGTGRTNMLATEGETLKSFSSSRLKNCKRQSSFSHLLRNRAPLINIPLSAGRHHSMATR